jgi:hypothetical protein
MGFAISTSDTFEYVLQDKRDLNNPPKLIFRYLSARDNDKLDKLFEDATLSDDIYLGTAKALEGISLALVGWTYKTPFKSSEIDNVLTRADIFELKNNLSVLMTISQSEKKVSVLRLQSTLDKSVKTSVQAA